MNRQQRLLRNARMFALRGFLLLTLCVTGVIWATVATLDNNGYGFPLLAVAAVALGFAVTDAQECSRIMRQIKTEQYWDRVRGIRPKI